jgi:L-ascorbate metabolism protein UlaG (beta-lactamase superfamily)
MTVGLTFFGHSTLRVELAGTTFLTDPILRRQVMFLRWAAPAPVIEAERGPDAVLISHLHYDHLDLPSLELLGRDRTVLVPEGAESLLRGRGFRNVVPMVPGRSYVVNDIEVTATEAEHDGRRRPGGPRGPALGYVLAGGGRRVYFAGDTDLFPGMADIGPDLDVALIPVWGWGRSIGPGHLDPSRAAEAVGILGAGLAVPIHWGAMRPAWERRTMATWNWPADEFAAEAQRLKVPCTVTVVPPGESLTWPAHVAPTAAARP